MSRGPDLFDIAQCLEVPLNAGGRLEDGLVGFSDYLLIEPRALYFPLLQQLVKHFRPLFIVLEEVILLKRVPGQAGYVFILIKASIASRSWSERFKNLIPIPEE